MCGICGIWNRNGLGIDPTILITMRDSMTHRGPDGAGCVLFPNDTGMKPVLYGQAGEIPQMSFGTSFPVGLAHRRLSIIDLDTGDQPMANEDQTIWIVFNGEIYNFRELRRELEAKGHIFRSSSDTEVILHAYEEYGTVCPGHFNGIFAFALWDIKQRWLFLARDHFGVKPLYYYGDDKNCFSFASEMKAILCDGNIARELDLDALNMCLTFRHTPSPWTLLKGIKKLPPGCSMTITSKKREIASYFQKAASVDSQLEENEWIVILQSALEKAVIRQMVSDVPIGISLSSGVDSTAILALMSQHSSGPVNAFTVGFAGRETTSEIEPARRQTARFGARFFEQIITSQDYSNFMDRYLWHLEEPIGNESAAAYYFVAEMARQQNIKVLLNGQGADEAFAGYGRYFGIAHSNWLKYLSGFPFRQVLPPFFAGKLIGERYQRFLYSMNAVDETDRFLRVYAIMTEDMKARLFSTDVAAVMNRDLPREYIHQQLSTAPPGSALERMTYIDTRTSLPDNLLLCEDKMAMAASVEARVPFLDVEFMKVAESIPGKFKIRGRRDKYIHRKACNRWVGDEVTSRPQIGFDNAVDLWLRAQLGEHLMQIVDTRDSFCSTYCNTEYIKILMQEHLEKRRDHQRILFLLLSLESWSRTFLH